LNSLNYTQSADTLLVVHPDVSPRQITRGDNEEWKIGEWEYYTKDSRVFCPFYNYYNHKAKINPRGTGGTITVLSETNIFTPDSVGSLINVRDGQIKISEYVSASEVKAVVNKGLSSTGETVDWEESAFSPQRGWPNSVTFHQNRLVVGGSKSLPNRLWFSKSADLFNFDIGTGLDDEAIEFTIKLKDSKQPIGKIDAMIYFQDGGDMAMFGYWLGREFQGRGLAQEACYSFCDAQMGKNRFKHEYFDRCGLVYMRRFCHCGNGASDRSG